jgi:hypothetical protein
VLLANPRLVVHSFDPLAWKYSPRVVKLLQLQFGRRLVVHGGNSLDSVPLWAANHSSVCDLLFIDGDHSYQGALTDMRNMHAVATRKALVVADDINAEPGQALNTLALEGAIDIVETYGPFDAPHVYNPCMRTIKRGTSCLPWSFGIFQYRGGYSGKSRQASSSSGSSRQASHHGDGHGRGSTQQREQSRAKSAHVARGAHHLDAAAVAAMSPAQIAHHLAHYADEMSRDDVAVLVERLGFPVDNGKGKRKSQS